MNDQKKTKAQLIEASLRESEERFRAVFQEGPIGIGLLDLNGNIEHVNQRFCEMLGYSEQEIVARGLSGITHSDDLALDRELVGQLGRGEIPRYVIEKRYLCRDGKTIWGRLNASVTCDAKGMPATIIGMVEDITERKTAEMALQEAHDQLEHRVEERTAELKATNQRVHEPRDPEAPAVEYHDDVQFNRLPPILENAVYRIAQEAVSNACRHSRSEKVRVSLRQEGDLLQLEVQDWGIGFDPAAVDESRFGLLGIKERTRLLGGEIDIQTELGKGTRIRAVLPIIEERAP